MGGIEENEQGSDPGDDGGSVAGPVFDQNRLLSVLVGAGRSGVQRTPASPA